ncbi:hypothetical protein, partial [Salmonella sp. s54412]|uniref:hypothetical protein n=1 Tax=Salmonella sp. s54412 TaxID=3160128 RepID=UPI0037550FA7
ESYSSALKIENVEGEEKSKSSAVLAITLGVVFGILAIILIIGIVFYVRKRSIAKDNRGMSVNTYDSSMPLKD